MEMMSVLLMLVTLLAPAQGGKGGQFQAKNYNFWCDKGRTVQLQDGEISNDPGGLRMEVGCCGVNARLLVKDNIVSCCPIVHGTASVSCQANQCSCVGGKGHTVTRPNLKRITGTVSGSPPADADSWPTEDYSKSQAKNFDMWCPRDYFITGHKTEIQNRVQRDNSGGKRLTFGCCKLGSEMIFAGNIFMCCPVVNGRKTTGSCSGNRCYCDRGDGHAMVAPRIKRKSEIKECSSSSCYRKRDNIVIVEAKMPLDVDEEQVEAFKEGEWLPFAV